MSDDTPTSAGAPAGWTPPAVPPYAEHLYPPAAGAAPVAQQPYPGAPPQWTTPAPAWGAPPPTGSATLAVLALVFAILGALLGFIPFVGAFLSWLLLIPAIVLGIVALVRRTPGRGMAIASLIVAGVGGVVAVMWTIAVALFGTALGSWSEGFVDDSYTYEEDYSYPSLGPSGLEAGEGTRETPLAFSTPVTLIDESTGEEVWEITVAPPLDGTTETDDVPLNGAYVAVGVRLTNLTDREIDISTDYAYTPMSFLLTGDGGRAETDFLADPLVFPSLWGIGPIAAGDTVTYVDVFDVGPSVVQTGRWAMDFDSGEQLFWGPAAG